MSDSYQLKIDVSAIDKMIKKFEAASKAVDKLQAKIDKLNDSTISPTVNIPTSGIPTPSSSSGTSPGGNQNGGVSPNGKPIPGTGGNAPPKGGTPPPGKGGTPAPGKGGTPAPGKGGKGKDDEDGEKGSKPRIPRFPVPGGLSPGLGKLLGFISQFGPTGMIAGSAVGAVAAAASYGMEQQDAKARIQYGLGATVGESVRIRAMGEGAAKRAMGFGDVLRSGTLAGGYFRDKGLIDLGQMQTNKATNYLRAIEILRNERNPSVRIRMAREAGLEEDMWRTDVSDENFQKMKDMERAKNTDSERQRNADRRARQEQANAVVQGLGDRFGDMVNRTVNDVSTGNPIKILSRFVQNMYWKDFFFPSKDEDKAKVTRKGNKSGPGEYVDPLNQRTPQNEIVGGGERVQSSANISQAMTGINSYGLQQAIRLGAFPVY